MKIVQLFGSLNRGGAEVLTYDVCKHFPGNLGQQFLVTYRGGDMQADFTNSKIPLYKINKGLFGISLIKELRSFVKKNDIHIIHVHKSIDVFYVKIAAIGLNTKIVQTVHSTASGSMYKMLRRIVKRMTDHLFFVSEDILNKFKSKHPITNKYSVLYNGIDKQKFMQKNVMFVKELHLPKAQILAGMVGNFNDVRDHFTICLALNNVIIKNPDFHFIFVGSNQGLELEDKCKRYCEKQQIIENVHFLGTRSDIPEILDSLDLFIYSSNRDTFGIAVVEAMMSGTPVIVNDLPVFQEITENGTYAQLYKTKDADDLAEKIEYFIRHPEARAELGERGRQYALENFTIEKHIEQLHSIYTELLSD